MRSSCWSAPGKALENVACGLTESQSPCVLVTCGCVTNEPPFRGSIQQERFLCPSSCGSGIPECLSRMVLVWGDS